MISGMVVGRDTSTTSIPATGSMADAAYGVEESPRRQPAGLGVPVRARGPGRNADVDGQEDRAYSSSAIPKASSRQAPRPAVPISVIS